MTQVRRGLWVSKYLKPWLLRVTGKPGWLVRLRGIPGGITPASHKAMSLQQKIVRMPSRQMPLPSQLILPLRQHIGPDAVPVVCAGDYVYKHQLIAKAAFDNGVCLHAPSSGIVNSVDFLLPPINPPRNPERSWRQSLTERQRAIVIDTDGKDAQQPGLAAPVVTPWQQQSPTELLQAVFNAGLCGLGGAGFPTAIKLGSPAIHTLIINGAECEPYITADEALMQEHAAQVIEGALIIQRICGAQTCVIGIEADKHEAIAAVQQAIRRFDSSAEALQRNLSVVLVPPIYPSGGEKQLIRIITGIQPSSGQRPVDVGVLCHSVATARAVYKAVAAGEPLVSRVTTVTGHAIRTAANVEALIGTPVSHLLAHLGVDYTKMERLLVGGPLMGYLASGLDTPVLKTSNCLLAGSDQDINRVASDKTPHRDCIRCDFCASVCPVKLQPQTLYFAARHEHHEASIESGLFDCIECGACAVVCPSHIPLVDYYREEKSIVRSDNNSGQQKYWQSLFEKHQQRLTVTAVDQQQRKLDKLQHKLDTIAAGESVSKASPPAAPEPGVAKSAEQIKQEIAAAVARTRARKMELQNTPDENQGTEP